MQMNIIIYCILYIIINIIITIIIIIIIIIIILIQFSQWIWNWRQLYSFTSCNWFCDLTSILGTIFVFPLFNLYSEDV